MDKKEANKVATEITIALCSSDFSKTIALTEDGAKRLADFVKTLAINLETDPKE